MKFKSFHFERFTFHPETLAELSALIDMFQTIEKGECNAKLKLVCDAFFDDDEYLDCNSYLEIIVEKVEEIPETEETEETEKTKEGESNEPA